ncbi:hypothetical protein CEXT_316521 [Caerostris extrusa]|uniref:Uncharacterized protein n=1 Tax=Caerostris extrusa TaxID=172846 RepID=A0AAV4TTG8_CAEEX|nr:hypothetical protein CEXT_316521 [Caerostris extrusa]
MDAREGIGRPLKPKRKVPVVIKNGADSTEGGCPFQQVVRPLGHGTIWKSKQFFAPNIDARSRFFLIVSSLPNRPWRKAGICLERSCKRYPRRSGEEILATEMKATVIFGAKVSA